MNIRSGPGTNYQIIGKMYENCSATVLEELGEWTKISTGTIKEGYASTQYLMTEDEFKGLADELGAAHVTVTVSSLNVRSGPSTSYDRIGILTKGDRLTACLTQSYEEWIAVVLDNGKLGYISAKYATLELDFAPGVTLKEIEQKEREAELAQAMARARIYTVEESWRAPISMTDDEIYLLATVITTEAGDQPYEGMLAVANVILNRMENGYWGTTLEQVLFAPGQFAGAKKEYMDRAQARGIPDACFRAAREALSGRNNIGDFMYFCADYSAQYAKYDIFYILGNHVFYKRHW